MTPKRSWARSLLTAQHNLTGKVIQLLTPEGGGGGGRLLKAVSMYLSRWLASQIFVPLSISRGEDCGRMTVKLSQSWVIHLTSHSTPDSRLPLDFSLFNKPPRFKSVLFQNAVHSHNGIQSSDQECFRDFGATGEKEPGRPYIKPNTHPRPQDVYSSKYYF